MSLSKNLAGFTELQPIEEQESKYFKTGRSDGVKSTALLPADRISVKKLSKSLCLR